jgi:hypothetical protein
VQDGWKLQRQQVVAFLQALERHYRPNPYHNSTHAADVTQAAAIILRSLRTGVTGITQLEVCACILGAAVHDLAHPGVNNDFLINSRDSSALLYNDRSVNENFHVSTAFTLAYSSPELNVFSGFSREEEKQVGGAGLAGWWAGPAVVLQTGRQCCLCWPLAVPPDLLACRGQVWRRRCSSACSRQRPGGCQYSSSSGGAQRSAV